MELGNFYLLPRLLSSSIQGNLVGNSEAWEVHSLFVGIPPRVQRNAVYRIVRQVKRWDSLGNCDLRILNSKFEVLNNEY